MMELNCSSALPECLSECACIVQNGGGPTAVDYQSNVPIAFLMVTGAGLSTTLGAALVFCNRCVTETNHKILGASLGFSSGVMLYVSFVEIFEKAKMSFTQCDCLWDSQSNENAAYVASTLCFFGGVAVVYVLDMLVHAISKHGHGHSHGPDALVETKTDRSVQNISEASPLARKGVDRNSNAENVKAEEMDELALNDELSGDEDRDNLALRDPDDFLDKTLSRSVNDGPNNAGTTSPFDLEKQMARRMQEVDEVDEVSRSDIRAASRTHGHAHDNHSHEHIHYAPSHLENALWKKHSSQDEPKRLAHMGLMTALAIGLHNFPEGLATFVAALANPQVGGALAVAIAIHNIPEGLCVSVPIYYATGNRWKGFWVAFFSGITEIIGAALGYGFLMSIMGPAAYAVLFGIVSGMMVTIVVKELLPTAHRYDPKDNLVTLCIFVGMMVMALSLILFRI